MHRGHHLNDLLDTHKARTSACVAGENTRAISSHREFVYCAIALECGPTNSLRHGRTGIFLHSPSCFDRLGKTRGHRGVRPDRSLANVEQMRPTAITDTPIHNMTGQGPRSDP
jgi:hypothetical protein